MFIFLKIQEQRLVCFSILNSVAVLENIRALSSVAMDVMTLQYTAVSKYS
jgi:hypothetical protein